MKNHNHPFNIDNAPLCHPPGVAIITHGDQYLGQALNASQAGGRTAIQEFRIACKVKAEISLETGFHSFVCISVSEHQEPGCQPAYPA